jgi:hypothetical protein
MPFRKPRTVTPTAAGGGLPASLTAVHPYPGPDAAYDPRTGSAIIGPHADGSPARWSLHSPHHGLHSGLIIGAQAGASTLATQLAATATHIGVLDVWAADLHDGINLPAVLANTDRPATTPHEIHTQMSDLAALIAYRQHRLGLAGQTLHQPSPADPGVLLIVEDWPGLFGSRSSLTPLARHIALHGRKAAVALVLVSAWPQASTLDPHLRGQLAHANLAALRLADAVPPLPGLPADPRQIPSTLPGVGYLANRPHPFRGWHLTQPDARRLLATAPPVHLNPAPAAAHGRG